MPIQTTIFAQLMTLIDHKQLNRCIEQYQGNTSLRTFLCLDQFLCMAFAQIGEKKSLSATVFALTRMKSKLYHMGIRGKVAKSTLADANNKRDWRIWRDYVNTLIPEARTLYKDQTIPVDEEINATVYAFDSSTITLCLSVFEWAHFRKTKSGIKLHTQVDLRGSIPVYIDITNALGADVKALDNLVLEAFCIYLLDRGYVDFARLYKFTQSKAFFVTRAKANTKFSRVYSKPVDKISGLICDQIGYLSSKKVGMFIPKSCVA